MKPRAIRWKRSEDKRMVSQCGTYTILLIHKVGRLHKYELLRHDTVIGRHYTTQRNAKAAALWDQTKINFALSFEPE